MSELVELKPCPFCGEYPLVAGAHIWCPNSSCWGPSMEQYTDAPDAIAAWNRRPEIELLSASPSPAPATAVPDRFAVYSVSGAHIGVWNTREAAEQVLSEYRDGRIEELYLAPVTAPAPAPVPSQEQGETIR